MPRGMCLAVSGWVALAISNDSRWVRKEAKLTTATQQTSRILVVDDEENLRNILVFQLRSEGYEARGLGRGDETLPTALNWQPDLVLLDLMMPGMDGFGVCRALRQNESTEALPIIVITARGDAATRLQALVAGAHEFVVKPYSWDELLTRIQNVLELTRRHEGAVSFVGLPGSATTEAEITRLLNAQENFAFMNLDVDYFRRFNERFGYSKGDEVVHLLAAIVKEEVAAKATQVEFIAHLGGDDFVTLLDPDVAADVGKAITQRFDEESKVFFSERDLERGYYEIVNRSGRRQSVPLLSLTVAIVHQEAGSQLHPRQLTDSAAELRVYGKSQPGSIVVTDRRRLPR